MPSSLQKKAALALLAGFLVFPAPTMADNGSSQGTFANLITTRSTETNNQIVAQKTKIAVEDKEFSVNYIIIPKDMRLKCDVSIGQGSVGRVAELSALAGQSEALIAINGGYFQSFDSTKPMDPYGTIIKNGRLIHKGETGSVVGITSAGEVKIAIVEPVITATIAGRNLEIDLFNHTPAADGSTLALFNKHRGESINFSYGRSILISGGEVTQIVNNRNTQIPTNGYVINLTGDALAAYGDLFQKGTKISFKVSYRDQDGKKLNWSNVNTAIGAGPILLQDGAVAINLAKEKFADEKSTQMTIARSAIGATSDGDLILAAGVSCTTAQLAEIMAQLGAVKAISLDGGASSGLYVNEQYIIKPSRNISNALVFKLQ